ncbi:MAG: hypothetical protein JST31_00425 [Actinobacteria bacterium]|nr:hypothetical protein [Actinomycetota bacterium]
MKDRGVTVRFGRWATVIGVLSTFLVLVAAAPALAAPTWHLQRSAEPSGFLNGISFLNASHGWAVGSGGRILATSNGGETWVQQANSAVTGGQLYAVHFVDEQHGWAVGQNGTIVVTTNGGATWTKQTSGTTELLSSVSFVNAQHGWVVGAGGTILTTSDGGTTWTPQTSGVTSALTSVSFADAEHGWAVGISPAKVLVTTNGGATWSEQAVLFGGANSVFAVDSQHAWVVGVNGKIQATTNGGTTWSEQTSGVSSELKSAYFADDLHGWAVGAGGTLLATHDGGEHWTAETSGTTEALNGVSAADSTHAGAVGQGSLILGYFEPGPATSLEVSAPGSATAGTPINFNVTARDSIGHLATGYAGSVHFSSLDPNAVLPADSTLTQGTGEFAATLKTAGNSTIYAGDGTLVAGSGYISVSPGAAHELKLIVPSSVTAGVPFNFVVKAFDEFGNVATGYSGTVHFSSSDGAASLPADMGLHEGQAIPIATLRTAGYQTITAGDGTISGTSNADAVAPGATAKLAITAPATAKAGTPFDFEVESLDAFGNPTPTYAGPVHFTSTDPSATLPADAMLTGGKGSFKATLENGGDQTISATDTFASSVTGTSATIGVGKVTPTLSLVASSGVTLGGAVNAAGELNGLAPSGQLEFSLYGPADSACSGAPVFTASAPVAGNGKYISPSFTPTAPGTYRWVVTYGGDGANLGAASACADPAAAVTVAAPPVNPPAPPSPRVVISYSPDHPHTPNRAGGPRYTFVFSDQAPSATFYCRLDGKRWRMCSSPTVYRRLKPGQHVFRVKSVAASGLESAVETVKFTAGHHR